MAFLPGISCSMWPSAVQGLSFHAYLLCPSAMIPSPGLNKHYYSCLCLTHALLVGSWFMVYIYSRHSCLLMGLPLTAPAAHTGTPVFLFYYTISLPSPPCLPQAGAPFFFACATTLLYHLSVLCFFLSTPFCLYYSLSHSFHFILFWCFCKRACT